MAVIRLESEHPSVAFRDCNHCRKYLYNEVPSRDAGKPILARGTNEPVPRPPRSLPMCEREDGCPKGHWKKPITKLSQRDHEFVVLVRASMATGGAVLTQAERLDALFTHALAHIATLLNAIDRGRAAATTGMAVGGMIRSATTKGQP